MAYARKTKDVWRLYWNGEEIDSFDTPLEARTMRMEYALAFHCGVSSISIKKGREKI